MRPLIDPDVIPAELRQLPRWVVWRFEDRNGKRTKVPYDARTGNPASSTDPRTWASFAQVHSIYERTPMWDGLGFVFSDDDDILGIDIDHIRDDAGELNPAVIAEAESFGSYAEISPSGEGVHVFVRGKIPGERRRAGTFEIYSSGRYFTMTGKPLNGCRTINENQPAIDAYYHAHIEPAPASRQWPAPMPSATPDLSDDEIIRLCESARNGPKFSALWRGDVSGYTSHSEADLALCNIMAFYTQDAAQINGLFQRSGLWRPKWAEMHGTQTYGEATVARALEGVRETYSPPRRVMSPDETPPDIADEALQILREGDPLVKFRETFKTLHSGDMEVLDTIVMAQCAQAALTTQGIQPVLSGSTGAGKTSSVQASLHLSPLEYLISGSFSDKSLFYDSALKPACVIFSDDTELKAEILSTVKRAMSNFQEVTQHRTIVKDHGKNVASVLEIPPRQVFMFTSVHDVGDDQLGTRQYRVSVERTPSGERDFLKFTVERMRAGRELYPVSHDVLVCREMLREVKKHLFRVVVPFADRVRFSDISSARNILMFYDFIQAAAVLRFMQRVQIPGDDAITLEAAEEDFFTACDVFQTNEETRRFDLTKAEKGLLDFIIDRGGEIAEPDLIRLYADDGKRGGATRMKVRRLLYGNEGRGGLLAKIPGMTVDKQTRTLNEDTRRAVNIISAPPSARSCLADYSAWVELAGCTGEYAKECVNCS